MEEKWFMMPVLPLPIKHELYLKNGDLNAVEVLRTGVSDGVQRCFEKFRR